MSPKNNKKCCTFETEKDSLYQGDDIFNLEVNHNDDEGPQAKIPLALNETIHNETTPFSPQRIKESQEHEKCKNDAMGQDMSDIIPAPVPKVSTSANYQEIIYPELKSLEKF
ncbi:hypothetical protein O181_095977 [Austropuccinia psidii MF-1]|uniref:Uncharacterized protein n=1 Tax=Austropuccinia psidii MF-1 TaxID=1389203 RepID=A0A9Q3J6E2_9BASI|nr:hypothetical protein [Austropuccinia psidii MF-1]